MTALEIASLAILTALDTAKRLGLRVKDYVDPVTKMVNPGIVAVHSSGLSEDAVHTLRDWRRYCHLSLIAPLPCHKATAEMCDAYIGKTYAWMYFERSAFEAATYHDPGHFKNILEEMYSKPEVKPATFNGAIAQLKEAAEILKGVKADAAGYKHSIVWEAFSVGNGGMGEKHSLGLYATEALAKDAAKGTGIGGADGFVESRKVYHEIL